MTVHEPAPPLLNRVQDILLHTEDIADFLQRFTADMTEHLSTQIDPVWCAVTLLREKRAGTAVSSNPDAKALDELQATFGDGPCLTAIRESALTHVRDTLDDGRWRDYLSVAAENGVRSALGVPFDVGDEPGTGAALDVYAAQPHSFSEATIERIRHEVQLASSALQLAVRMARHRETEENLRAAMASRTPIDLAVGIIMGQNRCTQDEAVEILKRASSHRNIKLRDLAVELVERANQRPADTHYET